MKEVIIRSDKSGKKLEKYCTIDFKTLEGSTRWECDAIHLAYDEIPNCLKKLVNTNKNNTFIEVFASVNNRHIYSISTLDRDNCVVGGVELSESETEEIEELMDVAQEREQ